MNFTLIPNNVLQPLWYAEVSNAKAAGGATARPTLIPGQALGSGYVANIPVKIMSVGTANTLFRPGSHLARSIMAYMAGDPNAEIYALPVADAGGAVPFVLPLKIVVTGTPGAGVVNLYIAGQRLTIPVTPASTATSIGDAIVAALGNSESAAAALGSTFPVFASNATGTVSFTGRNGGTLGNQTDFRVNYLGAAGGEQYPTGVAVQYNPAGGGWIDLALAYTGSNSTAPACNAINVGVSGGATLGATDPNLATAVTNMGDRRYTFVVCPWSTKGSGLPVTLLAADFADTLTGRWGPMRKTYGGVYGARVDTATNLAALATDNSPHVHIYGIEASPTPPWELAAEFAAACAPSIRNDPARPLNTLVLQGAMAPAPADQFSWTEREQILANGITTPIIDSAGNVRIQRAVSTYTKNAYGAADASFRDATTTATLDYMLTEQENLVTNKYGRTKLVSNGTPITPGMAAVTPDAIKNALVAQYMDWERAGLCENSAVFAKLLTVTRDTDGNSAGDPTRVNVYFPPDLANGLMVIAALAEYRLQYSPVDLAA